MLNVKGTICMFRIAILLLLPIPDRLKLKHIKSSLHVVHNLSWFILCKHCQHPFHNSNQQASNDPASQQPEHVRHVLPLHNVILMLSHAVVGLADVFLGQEPVVQPFVLQSWQHSSLFQLLQLVVEDTEVGGSLLHRNGSPDLGICVSDL